MDTTRRTKADLQTEVEQLRRRVAELEAAAASAAELEAKWRTIWQHAPAVITTFDRTGRILSVGGALTQLPLAAARDRSVFEYLPDEMQAHAQAVLRRVFEQRTSEIFESYYDVTPEMRVWFDNHVNPLVQDGEVTAAIIVSTDITERKHAELALRESEERFITFMKRFPAAVFISDEHHRAMYVNPAFEALLGADLLGKAPSDVLPPEIAAAMEADNALALAGQIVARQESLPIRDGTLRVFQTMRFPIPRTDGQPAWLGGFAIDVTEQEQMRRDLQLSEARYRSVFEAARDALFVLEQATGAILDVNPSACAMYGYTREEFLQMTNIDVSTEPDKTRHALLHGETYVQRLHRRKDGTVFPVEITSNRFSQDDRGMFVAAIRDLSERVHAEETLRDSEQKYRAFFETETDAVFLIDQVGGQIVDANPAAAQVYGYTLAELLTLNIAAISAEPDATVRAMQQGVRLLPLRYHRKADGTVFPCEVRLNTFNWRSQPHAMVAVRDITERQRAEDALKQRNRELAILNRASQALTSTLELNSVLASVLDELRRMLDVSASSIWLLDQDTNELVCRQATGSHAEVVRGWRVPVGTGFVGWTVAQDQSLIITDALTDTRHFPGVDKTTGMIMRSIVSVPLRVHQAVIGVVQAVDEMPGRFDISALRLIELLANAAAIAVENARLFEETRRRAERLTTLKEISTSISLPVDEKDVMRSGVYGLARMLGVKQTALALFDEARAHLRLVEEATASGVDGAIGLEIPLIDNPSMGHVLATKAPLMIMDAQHDPLLEPLHDIMRGRRVWSILIVPLIVRGEVIGTLGCDAVGEPRRFTPEEVELATTVANLLAARIEQARLLAAERDQRIMAEALRDSAAELVGTLKFEAVLDRVLDRTASVLAYDVSGVMLVDADGVAHVVRARGYSSPDQYELAFQVRLPVEHTANLRIVTETRQPLIIDDVRSFPGWIATPSAEWERSLLNAPIRLKDKVIGFLYAASSQPNFFTAQQAQRLQAFADLAAIAIENSRLYEQVERHAAELEKRVQERTAELQRERNRLQTVFDSAGEGIQIMDLDFHITYCNPATERITGYSTAEIVGLRSRIIDGANGVHGPSAEIARTLERGATWSGEMISRRKDGHAFDIAITVSPLRDADGAVTGYVSVHRDVSRLKELDRLRNQFVSNIGHELRTPLTNLIIYLDLLEHGKPDKRSHYMATLTRESDRLRRLVEGFLRISELDANRMLIDLVSIDLNQLAAEVVHQHRARAAQREIVLLYEPEPNLPRVRLDIDLVTDVIKRLLDNALNYTPRGGAVTCSAEQRLEAGQQWVTFSVKDTGPGLLPEELPRMFERFYRGSVTRDYAVPGVGLSLAICKETLEKIDGRITVDSTAGQGATYTVWLPAV